MPFSVEVNPLRCEGAKDCITACEPRVFAMRPPPEGLPLLIRFKVMVHGGKQAYARNESACTGCMKCVEACPEDAIRVTAR
jgi:NAD-dependent dihydropyrimidine dehydrogenase PreA subunit